MAIGPTVTLPITPLIPDQSLAPEAKHDTASYVAHVRTEVWPAVTVEGLAVRGIVKLGAGVPLPLAVTVSVYGPAKFETR